MKRLALALLLHWLTAGIAFAQVSLLDAVKKDNLQQVKNLVQQGADVNAKDKDGFSVMERGCAVSNDPQGVPACHPTS